MLSKDYSLTGWGTVYEDRMVQGVWNPPWSGEHIIVLELRGAHLVLVELVPFIKGRHVLVKKDNCVLYCVPHKSPEGHQISMFSPGNQEVLAVGFSPSSRAVYIPGVEDQAADLGPPPRRIKASRACSFTGLPIQQNSNRSVCISGNDSLQELVFIES